MPNKPFHYRRIFFENRHTLCFLGRVGLVSEICRYLANGMTRNRITDSVVARAALSFYDVQVLIKKLYSHRSV